MQTMLLSTTAFTTSALYGGGAVLLGGISLLLFIGALVAKKPKAAGDRLSEVARLTGPASAAGQVAAGPHDHEVVDESVVQIDEDDPRMAAAVAEAKKRLPEFAEAFARARDGWQFSVQVPFAEKESEESEFMWVAVFRVDFDAVHGTLLNDPEYVKGLKYDDVVRVPMERIIDWVYTDGEK